MASKTNNLTTLLQQALNQGDNQATLAEVRKLIAQAGINDETTTQTVDVLNSQQNNSDQQHKTELLASLLELEKLTNQQAKLTQNSNTQPAKASGAVQLDSDIAKATARLQQSLGQRDTTRKSAYKATQTDLGLDVTDPGAGGNLARTILNNEANQLASINNGSAAAHRLATEDPLSKGGWYRTIFGNTYAAGVSDAKDRLGDLSSSFKTVKQDARSSFTDALLKDTPLSEITTRFNSDVTQANASAEALTATGLIAPTQSALDAQAVGLQVAQAKQASTIQTQVAGVDRVATNRNIQGANQAFTRGTSSLSALSQGLNIIAKGNEGVYTNPDGSFFSATATPADKANSSSILANNATTSARNLSVRQGTASVGQEITNAQFNINAGVSAKKSALPLDAQGNINETKLSKQQKVTFNNTKADPLTQDTASITARAQLEANGQIPPDPTQYSAEDKAKLKTETERYAQQIASDRVRIATTAGRLSREAVSIKERLADPDKLSPNERVTLTTQLDQINKDLQGALNEEYQLTLLGDDRSKQRLADLDSQLRSKQINQNQYDQKVVEEKTLHVQNSIYNATSALTPEARALHLRNAEIQRVSAEVDLDVLNSRNALVTNPVFQQASVEQRTAMLLVEGNKAQVKRSDALALSIELDGGVNDSSISEQAQLAQARKSLAILSDKQLQAAELSAKSATLVAQKAQAEGIVGDLEKKEILDQKRQADFYVLTGDNILPDNTEVVKRLDAILPDGRLGDNPYSAVESLGVLVPNQTLMQKKVGYELANMKGQVIGNNKRPTSSDINVSMQALMNPTEVTSLLSIGDSKQRGTLLDVPTLEIITEILPEDSPHSKAIASIPTWNKDSMQDKLTNLKNYWQAQLGGDNVDISVLSKNVSDSMSAVMTAKGRAGDFRKLGLPEITSLRYNVVVSDLINSASTTITRSLADSVNNALPNIINPETTVPVDVLSQSGISLMIRNGKL